MIDEILKDMQRQIDSLKSRVSVLERRAPVSKKGGKVSTLDEGGTGNTGGGNGDPPPSGPGEGPGGPP